MCVWDVGEHAAGKFIKIRYPTYASIATSMHIQKTHHFTNFFCISHQVSNIFGYSDSHSMVSHYTYSVYKFSSCIAFFLSPKKHTNTFYTFHSFNFISQHLTLKLCIYILRYLILLEPEGFFKRCLIGGAKNSGMKVSFKTSLSNLTFAFHKRTNFFFSQNRLDQVDLGAAKGFQPVPSRSKVGRNRLTCHTGKHRLSFRHLISPFLNQMN